MNLAEFRKQYNNFRLKLYAFNDFHSSSGCISVIRSRSQNPSKYDLCQVLFFVFYCDVIFVYLHLSGFKGGDSVVSYY